MKILISVVLWSVSIISFLFIHTRTETGLIMLVLIAGLAWIQLKGNNKKTWLVGLLVIAGISELGWILFHVQALYVMAQMAVLIVVVYFLTIDRKVTFKGKSLVKQIGIVVGVIMGAIGVGLSSYLTLVFVEPLALTTLTSEGNVTEAKTGLSALENGMSLTTNVQYGTTYPNSFLDIYETTVEAENTPTFIYVHGGGFIFGDKLLGDPFGNTSGLDDYYNSLLEQGYNVVSVNYALASEYKYPTPIYQLSEAVSYLKEHAAEYDLDMSQVVFGGGSAGGQIVGQFAALQTNEAYRNEMKIKQSLKPAEIKAVVFNSAVLDISGMNKIGPFYVDWFMDAAARAYMGSENIDNDVNVVQSNVIEHVTKTFPPSYIDDGSEGSLADQATELNERLTELGVYNELYIVEGANHSYEIGVTQDAKDNLKRQIEFLNKVNP